MSNKLLNKVKSQYNTTSKLLNKVNRLSLDIVYGKGISDEAGATQSIRAQSNQNLANKLTKNLSLFKALIALKQLNTYDICNPLNFSANTRLIKYESNGFYGDPGRTRTLNLLIRSQLLYPVELRSRLSGI